VPTIDRAAGATAATARSPAPGRRVAAPSTASGRPGQRPACCDASQLPKTSKVRYPSDIPVSMPVTSRIIRGQEQIVRRLNCRSSRHRKQDRT
jgi:hypothetical protein